ncbi:MAG: hypothetical protein IPJ65_29915 [Archangiaceae bacterium]|nr:hypothetical protein [Archangiaceae bacterium]
MRRLVVVLLLGATACSKCGRAGGGAAGAASGGVERVLPVGANAYLIVPSVEQLGQKLQLVEQLKVASFVAQTAGVDDAHAYVDALVHDLGIDPRSREQLDKIGLLAGAPAGVAIMDDEGSSMVALPIKDEGRIGSFIRTFSANRLGASMVEDKTENGVTVHRFMGNGGAHLAWAAAHGYALIASRKAVDQLAGWAARAEGDTLAKDTSLPASLKRLPRSPDLVVYLPPGSKAMMALPVAHLVAVVTLDAGAFTVSTDSPWGGDKASLSVFEPARQSVSLAGLLPHDAFLVARFTGESSQLLPIIKPLLGTTLTRALAQGGFDLGQALEQVAPGAVLGLSLAPTAQMGAGLPDLDVRRTNPFSFVHLSGVAPVKSAAVVEPALAKLAEVAPGFGAQMTLKDGVYVTTYSQGEGVHFAAAGDRVLFGAPLSRVMALKAANERAPGTAADGNSALESSAVAVAVDLRKLSDAVRELPVSAWGIGGFAIKATTVRWLDNTDDLRAVTVTVGTAEGAVQSRVSLLLGASRSVAAGDAGR